jgi:hypothetical protein
MGWRDVEAQLASQVDPAVQRERDREALKIKQTERATATDPGVVAALDREIARDTTKMGPSRWREIDAELATAATPPAAAQVTPAMPLTAPAGRRGGTSRELRGSYGGEQAPGQTTENVSDLTPLLVSTSRGLTSNLIQYPTAALTYLLPGETGTYGERLANVKGMYQQMEQEHPIQSGLGQLAGTGIQAVYTGGGSLPAALGWGALSGGASGFSQNESLGEGAIGAGTGAVFGAGGRLIPAAQGAAVRSAVDNVFDKIASRYQKIGEKAWGQLPKSVKELSGDQLEAKLAQLATSGNKSARNLFSARDALQENEVGRVAASQLPVDVAQQILPTTGQAVKQESIKAATDLTAYLRGLEDKPWQALGLKPKLGALAGRIVEAGATSVPIGATRLTADILSREFTNNLGLPVIGNNWANAFPTDTEK